MKNPVLAILLGFVILVASVFLGSEIATENYSNVLIGLLIAFVVVYLTNLYKRAFIIILAVSLSGLSIHLPFGAINSGHIGVLLFLVTFAYDCILHPRVSCKVPEYKKGFIFYLLGALVIGFLYLYQIVNPVSPYEFSSKQTLKALLETLTPFLLMITWYLKNDATVFKVGSTRQMYLVLAGILLCHIASRVYLISIGALDEGSRSDEGLTEFMEFGPISISQYMLRFFGPLATLLGIFSFLHWKLKKTGTPTRRSMLILSTVLFLLGVVGALLSAGRGALVMIFLGVIAALILYQRLALLLMGGVSLFSLFVVLNIFSSAINDKLPDAVTRTLTLFILDDRSTVSESVESSSNWRKDLAEMAYEEWVSDPDLFIRGRGIYTYTEFDALSIQVYGGYEAMMYTSLKTASAHTQFLSLALKFGLIGLVLYYGLYLYILVSSMKFITKRPRHIVPPAYLVSLTLLGLMFPLSFIASGGLSFPLLLLLLSSRLRLQQDEAPHDKV
jgi:hypothetical protein